MENNNQEKSRVLSLAGVSFTKENPCGTGRSIPTSRAIFINLHLSVDVVCG
jgi:hypothetical protein